MDQTELWQINVFINAPVLNVIKSTTEYLSHIHKEIIGFFQIIQICEFISESYHLVWQYVYSYD